MVVLLVLTAFYIPRYYLPRQLQHPGTRWESWEPSPASGGRWNRLLGRFTVTFTPAFARAVFAGNALGAARDPLQALGTGRNKLLSCSTRRLLSPAAGPKQCPLNWWILLSSPLWAKYYFMWCGIWGPLQGTGLACSLSTQSHVFSTDLLLTW